MPIQEPLAAYCAKRAVCMAIIWPYKPNFNEIETCLTSIFKKMQLFANHIEPIFNSKHLQNPKYLMLKLVNVFSK